MTVYIAGPISGMPDGNRAAFAYAAADLWDAGHDPINPHDIVPEYADWTLAMRCCIRALTKADAIYLLPGWRRSRGAKIERRVARWLGIKEVRL